MKDFVSYSFCENIQNYSTKVILKKCFTILSLGVVVIPCIVIELYN